ncbi:MAG: hypothetical protein U9R77_14795 [Pseudomonadota bacterium]|uniref:hypothetical protein n=1 Tax=Sphingobium naphthae TaxID=1886786 RepID=UPI002B07B3A2|nr:hypothetical protein [Pseudomonadota bacterium]
MTELAERRNTGEPIHLILAEVALDHAVSLEELRVRAEQSWGAPLETDRERHSDYFAALDRKQEVVEKMGELMDSVYRLKINVTKKLGKRLDHAQEFSSCSKHFNFENSKDENEAREEFLRRAIRLENSAK